MKLDNTQRSLLDCHKRRASGQRLPYYTKTRRDARIAIESRRERKLLAESFGELTLSTEIV